MSARDKSVYKNVFLFSQAEELGCEGKVEEAQGIMKLCDQLNEERTQLQNVSRFIKDIDNRRMKRYSVYGKMGIKCLFI